MRLNLVRRPGSDLFVVFNEQRGSQERLSALDSRGAAVKVTYLIRF